MGAEEALDEGGTFRFPGVVKEGVELVDNVQRGIRSRPYGPRPLSLREPPVGWFAERVRPDLGRAVE